MKGLDGRNSQFAPPPPQQIPTPSSPRSQDQTSDATVKAHEWAGRGVEANTCTTVVRSSAMQDNQDFSRSWM
ncbi:uncharacterized protein PADG_11288 [Paracoccidioides brasiliensis Pb18]|uniref:Uncharacterized protein n=2 Tax=Paracoccidioides brasiliensis TaxID=121759 RepID=A0A0A0HV30_PARBD|nr:uncharacterized protein PADG_11288 [Paracoccidioides brasiliensis Pb18]KGM92467.1 hypothetical protein PADG_11288 [Paracoccidioides brasiliensis Pb18]ODH43345.1 hypothetical protein ACO22_01065 [Paracoccidioides brasiliensis]ODH50229.1 hypothetical protein GX48_03651 [Paracoccidioides brasiliensis]